jgi:endonuclease G
MRIDPETIARARLAVREAIRNHLFDPNVSMIDFGYPRRDGELIEDELAVRVHVKQKLAGPALESAINQGKTQMIPPCIGEFQTDVPRGAFRLRPQQLLKAPIAKPTSDPRRTENNPLCGGISISVPFQNSAGTLGGKVIDRKTGDEMILSNWHVLVGDWMARTGQDIYQPGRLDGGTPDDAIANLVRDAMSANFDAAVAKLNGDRPITNMQLGIGAVTGVGRAAEGMEVIKSGRTSGVTYGRVTSVILGTLKMRYGNLERIIQNVMRIDPRQPFEQVSAPGDSGSWWLDAETNQVVGLHFAGQDSPEQAVAIDMQSVLDALNVDVDSRITPASPATLQQLNGRMRR